MPRSRRADNPKGPFRDSSAEPLVCQFDLGGTIDANPFRDSDGKLYLYYKSDGNRVGKKTVIWGQRLADDGLSVVGAPSPLVEDDQKWEWKLVEAPTMVRSPAGYQLFYSAAFFGWDPKERLSRYATGYATCAGPLGPCKDAPENPILQQLQRQGRPAASAAPATPASSRRAAATSSPSTPGRRPGAAARPTTSATSTSRPCSGRTASRRSA